MNESIIVGLVVGGGVAVIGALASYYLRRWEMKDLWAEEERRRKSDRRRELYQRDLKIVSETVQGLTDTMARAIPAITNLRAEDRELSWDLIRESRTMMLKCIVVVASLEDPELGERFKETMDAFDAWWDLLLQWDAEKVKDRLQDQFSERAVLTQAAAAKTVRRIREILEEV